MPLPTTIPIPANLLIQGDLLVLGNKPPIARTDLVQDSTLHPIPLSSFRVWDAVHSLLPSAGANDDLGLIGGTFGTDVPSLQTGDVKTLTTTRYARCQVKIPGEYQAGQPLAIRVHAGMKTTVAGTSALLDLETFKSGKAMLVSGSDLYAGAAQSINSLTLADKDFSLNASTLLPGDELDIRLGIATVDAATVGAVIGVVGNVEWVVSTKG
jgi:hypothetical protein